MHAFTSSTPTRRVCAALLLAAASLAACGDKTRETRPGQALASVNGEEITVLQLNEELQRAGVTAAQQEAASKQLLQALIDRQLLQSAAAKENLERDPKVMQAIERARSLIVAQHYLQKRVGNLPSPTAAEVEAYFNQHPEFFAKRKQMNLNELIIASGDLTSEVRTVVEGAKTLDEVAAWLDARKIKYGRAQVVRSTTDLTPELSAKLLAMQKGQLFMIKEGERTMLMSIAEVKEAPVTLQVAAQQIEQFLMNKKNKEAAAAELARLRADARIEYINKAMAIDPKALPAPGSTPAAPAVPAAAAVPAAPAPDAAAPNAAATDPGARAVLDRGVAGLK